MAKSLKLDVVTPDKTLFSGEIESLVAPAVEGYLGVLPDHAPMIVGLVPGEVKYRVGGKAHFLAVAGGFMEIGSNHITLLADSAEKAAEIDRARAEAARERAEERLKHRDPGMDVLRAELALRRAIARIRVSDHGRD